MEKWPKFTIMKKMKIRFFIEIYQHTHPLTVLSRVGRSLFEPTRKSSPWDNFSDGGLHQSIKSRLSLQAFRLID